MKIVVKYNGTATVGEYADFLNSKQGILNHLQSILPEGSNLSDYKELFLGEGKSGNKTTDNFGYYRVTDRLLKNRVAMYSLEFNQ